MKRTLYLDRGRMKSANPGVGLKRADLFTMIEKDSDQVNSDLSLYVDCENASTNLASRILGRIKRSQPDKIGEHGRVATHKPSLKSIGERMNNEASSTGSVRTQAKNCR